MFLEPSQGRLIAVGDIHGNIDMLEALVKAINPVQDDTIIFLGDMVNRGPKSKQVVERIMNLSATCNVHCVCGNHEEMILQAYRGGQSEHKFWTKFGGLATLISYGVQNARDLPKDHLKFFAECKDYIETPNHIFVHASCNPSIPIEKNKGEILRWSSFDKNYPGHMSGKKVFCGHSPQREILDLKNICCIDTGCGIWVDGKLSAIDINSGSKYIIKHNCEPQV